MEIWKWELRKIANPGILAAIVLLGIVYYYMFPSFYIQYFRNGQTRRRSLRCLWSGLQNTG